jgi:hypothetical protein
MSSVFTRGHFLQPAIAPRRTDPNYFHNSAQDRRIYGPLFDPFFNVPITVAPACPLFQLTTDHGPQAGLSFPFSLTTIHSNP